MGSQPRLWGIEYHSYRYYVPIDNAIESCFYLVSVVHYCAIFQQYLNNTNITQCSCVPKSRPTILLQLILKVKHHNNYYITSSYPVFDIWISLCLKQSCYDSGVSLISCQH